MDKVISIILILVSVNTLSVEEKLVDEMKRMDSLVFGSFNNCEDEKQLRKHESLFSSNVEFYHDNGGVTWNRESMINNTEKFVCGKFIRNLINDSFQAYPIKEFGAITEGVHQFCKADTGVCDGKAKFLMVWQNNDGQWLVTRVISYGHLPN